MCWAARVNPSPCVGSTRAAAYAKAASGVQTIRLFRSIAAVDPAAAIGRRLQCHSHRFSQRAGGVSLPTGVQAGKVQVLLRGGGSGYGHSTKMGTPPHAPDLDLSSGAVSADETLGDDLVKLDDGKPPDLSPRDLFDNMPIRVAGHSVVVAQLPGPIVVERESPGVLRMTNPKPPATRGRALPTADVKVRGVDETCEAVSERLLKLLNVGWMVVHVPMDRASWTAIPNSRQGSCLASCCQKFRSDAGRHGPEYDLPGG